MKRRMVIVLLVLMCLMIGAYVLTENQTSDQIVNEVNEEDDVVEEINTYEDLDKVENEESEVETSEVETPEILPPSTGAKAGNTMSNLASNGLVATDGEWDYGLMATLTWEDHYLYKIAVGGTECIQLTDYSVNNIHIVEDWLYFITRYKRDAVGIYRMTKDGSKEELLFEGEVYDMVIIGDVIYFSNTDDDFKLYSMKTDGSDLKVFLDRHISRIQYHENELFFLLYSSEEQITSLYKFGISSRELVKLEDNVIRYTVYKDDVYFLTMNNYIVNPKLYKRSINNPASKVIINDQVMDNFFVVDDKIYFIADYSAEENIYTMDLDGNNIEVFFNGGFDYPVGRIRAVVGNTIYYWTYGREGGQLVRINPDGSFITFYDILNN